MELAAPFGVARTPAQATSQKQESPLRPFQRVVGPRAISLQENLSALLLVKEDFAFVAAIASKGGDAEFSEKLRGIIEGLLDSGIMQCPTRSVSPFARTARVLREGPRRNEPPH